MNPMIDLYQFIVKIVPKNENCKKIFWFITFIKQLILKNAIFCLIRYFKFTETKNYWSQLIWKYNIAKTMQKEIYIKISDVKSKL